MNHAEAIVSRRFDVSNGFLQIGGRSVTDLAEEFGTPLFVYDLGVVDAALGALRDALPARVEVYYSIKANPLQALLRRFVARGCGLEVASAGEFHQARTAGCEAARILFAGPGKTDAELRHVLAQGIGEIHAESLREIERIEALCRSSGSRAAVAVRVNPRAEVQGGAMRMGGRPAPFGIDEESIEPAVRALASSEVLDFHGVHLFLGTQILDAETLARQYAHGLEIARRASVLAGSPVATVDFGGGLGIPYYRGESPLDVGAYGAAVADLLAGVDGDPAFRGTRFLVEPGRYLVGEAGVYVCRVTEVKHSRGKAFAIVDGGMHHHLAASGNLGQVIKKNYPVVVANRMAEPDSAEIEVVGPLCTPLDVLARAAVMPEIREGDLVAVLQSGAYARASSPLGFLSHPAPAEVVLCDGRASLARARGGLDDALRDQAGPATVGKPDY